MPITDLVAPGALSIEVIIEALEGEGEPWGLGRWLKMKNIGMIELSLLGEVLGAGSYTSLYKGFGEVVVPRSASDTYLFLELPVALVEGIQQMAVESAEEVARRWCDTDHFTSYTGLYEVEALTAYLIELKAFLGSVVGTVYLFMGL